MTQDSRMTFAQPPGDERGHPQPFRIQIDKDHFELSNPTPTGRELLELAGKTPPERFGIYQKVRSGQPQRIQLDQTVDLGEPGTEKFVTLPLDQTEGLR